ncbi:DUF317 domain-containing protein [Streptomyces sp. NPDC093223]|uniref:DUF317 domain-containing protein n=1 Tax=Streptomyces sp. NPDC093223 TaxID=3366033 RepID=UPI00380DEC6D
MARRSPRSPPPCPRTHGAATPHSTADQPAHPATPESAAPPATPTPAPARPDHPTDPADPPRQPVCRHHPPRTAATRPQRTPFLRQHNVQQHADRTQNATLPVPALTTRAPHGTSPTTRAGCSPRSTTARPPPSARACDCKTTYEPKPDKPGKGTWTVSAHQAPYTPPDFTPPAWWITFDATTPVELLHDVHTELLDLYLEDLHSDQDRLFQDEMAPHEAYAPLLTRGWSHAVKTDGTQTFLTPDGLGAVRHRYDIGRSSGPAWRAWGGHPSEPHWRAHFSFGTPTTIVAAFTASLLSTEPLQRTVQDVPVHTRRALYVATPTGQQPPGHTPAVPPPPAPASARTR